MRWGPRGVRIDEISPTKVPDTVGCRHCWRGPSNIGRLGMAAWLDLLLFQQYMIYDISVFPTFANPEPTSSRKIWLLKNIETYSPGSTKIEGWKMDPDWVDVFPIEHGDIPASYVGLLEDWSNSVDGCRAGDPYSLSHSRFDAKHGIEGGSTHSRNGLGGGFQSRRSLFQGMFLWGQNERPVFLMKGVLKLWKV